MARVPARYECDLCKNPLDPDTVFPTLDYPLGPEDLVELVQAITDTFPQAHQFLGFVPINPRHRFHFCKDCVDRFLPMADAMKALAISIQKDEWVKRREQYEHTQIQAPRGPQGPGTIN